MGDIAIPDVPFTGFAARKWGQSKDDVAQWTTYFIYLGVVFGSPIAAGVIGVILMIIGYITCSFFEAPYGKLKRWLCNVAYCVLFVIMLILVAVCLTFLGISFFFFENIKAEGVGLVKGVLGLPSSLQLSLNQLTSGDTGLVAVISNDVKDIINQMDNINDPFKKLEDLVNATEVTVKSQAIFDNINAIVVNLTSSRDDIGGQGIDITGIDFSAYNISEGAIVIPEIESNDIFGLFETSFEAALGGIDLAKQGLEYSTNIFTDLINSTVIQGKDFLYDGVQVAVDAMDEVGVNAAGVDQVAFFSFFGEIGVLGVSCLFYIVASLIFLVGILCMRKNGTFLFMLSFFSCSGCFVFMLLGGVMLIFFFATDDVCNQAETTLYNAENYLLPSVYNLLDFEIPQTNGQSIEINLINVTLNVLHCGQPTGGNETIETFLDAGGISIADLNITDQLVPIGEDLVSNILQFDIGSFMEGVNMFSSNFSSITDNVPEVEEPCRLLLEEIEIMINKIDESLDSTYSFNATDERIKYEELNSLSKQVCEVNYTKISRSNINTYNTVTSNCTFTAGEQSQANTLVSDLQAYETIYTAQSSVQDACSQYDIIIIKKEEAIINCDAANEVVNFVNTIPGQTTTVSQAISDFVDEFMYNITGIVPNVMESIEKSINSIDILQCTDIGNFYSSLESDGCTGIVTSFGFIGFSTIGIGFVMFVMFWFLLYTGSMLIDYRKNFVDDDSDSSGSEYEEPKRRKGGKKQKRTKKVYSDEEEFTDEYSDEYSDSFSDDY